MTLLDGFGRQTQIAPDRQALQLCDAQGEPTAAYTWRELAELVRVCRANLISQVASESTAPAYVATWLPNSLPWIIVDLAIQSLGWVHVALDSRLPTALAIRLYEHSRARCLITLAALQTQILSLSSVKQYRLIDTDSLLCKSNAEHIETPLRSDVTSHAAAQILYTSGTISHPKGVVLSHSNLLSNAQAKLAAAPQHSADVRLNILPFAHAYARTCELSTWILSGSQLCLVESWSALLKAAPRIRPTLINLVPHLACKLADLLSNGADPRALLGDRMRLLQVGGAALPRAVWDRLATAGWPPLQGYGLTETSPVICSNRAGDQRPDSVGYPVAGVQLRLDDQGVLWTRGPHVMLGYHDDDHATRQRIVDGWLYTGDLASIDTEGRVRIHGRLDDQIILSTGYKVSPFELTQRLAHDPWLQTLVIVGQGRPHLTALVYPNVEQLPVTLRADPQRLVEQLIERFKERLIDLPRWMQLERVDLLPESPSVENGGLNFKGALRRKHIEEQWWPRFEHQ